MWLLRIPEQIRIRLPQPRVGGADDVERNVIAQLCWVSGFLDLFAQQSQSIVENILVSYRLMGRERLCELLGVRGTVGSGIVTIFRAEQIELRVSRQALVAVNRRVDIGKRRQGISQVGIEQHHS